MELSQRNWRRNGNQTALEEESVGEGEGGGGGQRLQKWEKRVTKDIKDSSHSIYSIIWCCWPFCMAPNAPLFCYHSTAYWLRSSADGFAPPPGSPGSPGSPDRIPGQDLWEWMADLWLSWLRKRIKISICDRFWMEWDGMESLISSAIAPLNGVNKRWKLAIFGWLWLNGFLIGSTLNSITEWERGKIWGERERERKKRASRVFYKRPTHPIHPASQPASHPAIYSAQYAPWKYPRPPLPRSLLRLRRTNSNKWYMNFVEAFINYKSGNFHPQIRILSTWFDRNSMLAARTGGQGMLCTFSGIRRILYLYLQ